jgi:mevalonate kinase
MAGQACNWPRPLTQQVNAAGFEGEKGYHGTPSGIDNTAATFGGLLRFQRTDGAPIFVRKQLRAPIRIVYASTGITASTSTVVGDVRAKKVSRRAPRSPCGAPSTCAAPASGGGPGVV